MSDAPYVQFYTSDFLAGTSGMTASCKGVYITLLCQMYEGEAPLKQSWDMLARRCGATLPAFKKALEALQDDGKITLVDGGIWSPKCEKHITLRRERQKSAKAAAEKRWEKTKEKQGKPDATAYDPQCYPEPEPYKDRDTIVSLARKPKPERFEDFWNQYPHRNGAKKGKAKARQKYERLVASGVSEHEIITGAMRYATDRQVVEGYAKDPTTWLNNEGWTDDIEPAQPSRANSNGSGTGQRSSMVDAFAAVAERRSRDAGGGGGTLI